MESLQTKNKTLGQQMLDTQLQHQKQQYEVGEFIEHVGEKEIMPEIWRQINARKHLPRWQPSFYVLTSFKKHSFLHRAFTFVVQCRHTKPRKEPGLTCYSFDTKTDELTLDWTLPQKHAFKTFLSSREYTDPFLMKCIDDYLSTNKIKIV